MAKVEEALHSRMKGFAGLTALVGTRIYPLKLPQDPTYPAVTFAKVSGPRERAMGADPGVVRSRHQVDSWSEDYDEAKSVSEQVRLALQRFNGTEASVVIHDIYLDNELDLFEPATDTYRTMLDFEVIYGE